ncbi:MAG: lipoyl(octanoyl) transferase LipB [Thiogranum sp.]
MVVADTGAHSPVLHIRHLGVSGYRSVWQEMQAFTLQRDADTEDELWLLEHPPVFTQGMNGRPEHLLAPGDIPVVAVDRGGQVTYHGPGQLVAYVLLDLGRLGIGIRRLVDALEQSVIEWLAAQGVTAEARRDAPGVYVDGAKIAALGLRVKRGCSYHGLAFNVDMDLEPFARINPCGYRGMPVTRLVDLGITLSVEEVGQDWLPYLAAQLRYTTHPRKS